MDEEFGFWSIVLLEVQLVLFGTSVTKDIVAESHIMHSGRLLCKESQEVLKNRVKRKYDTQNVKDKYSRVRPNSHVCEECLRLYKKNDHSAYSIFVNGKELKETAQPGPLKF